MEMEMQNQLSDQGANAGLGFSGKFINIFTNPSKTFAELINRPTWLMPLLIVTIVGAIASQFTLDVQSKATLEMIRNMPGLSKEQVAEFEKSQADSGSLTSRVKNFAKGIAAKPIWIVIVSAIFLFVGKVVLGGDSSFKKIFSIYCWSNLISIPGVIITSYLIILKKNMFVSLSPALVIPGSPLESIGSLILSQLEFFTLWQLAVFAIGFAMAFNISIKKAYVSVGALFAVFIALVVALTSILKSFGFA